MNKTDKIYVAGNTGLVGSALVRNLHAHGYDNQVYSPWPEWDLRRQDQAERFMSDNKPDAVIIAAAKVGGILANNTYPAEFIYDNLMIATNLIEAAYRNGVKKLLFLGSSCIYPKLCPQPIVEDYLLTGPLEPTNEAYALAKIAALRMCGFYRRQYGVDYISAMPTNLFGIGDNFNLRSSHVLPAMIRKCHLANLLRNNDLDGIIRDFSQTGEAELKTAVEIEAKLAEIGIIRENGDVTLRLWGTGSPRREFLYSDDLADALIYLLENYSGEQHVNVGTGTDLTIRELAEMVREVVGFEGILGWDATKPDGTPQKLLDVTKLHELGWKEKTGLQEGMRKVYQWYLDRP
jgi:GDP-L-fucose synthase